MKIKTMNYQISQKTEYRLIRILIMLTVILMIKGIFYGKFDLPMEW